jgi:hypothetical protein
VLFNYLDLDFKNDSSFGKSATVGIQTGTTKAALFSFNEAKLKNNMAILFENPK